VQIDTHVQANYHVPQMNILGTLDFAAILHVANILHILGTLSVTCWIVILLISLHSGLAKTIRREITKCLIQKHKIQINTRQA
jgi:hypothetical protein